LWVYVTFDGDYEYLQKNWKKFNFDPFYEFFNLVYTLKKTWKTEKKFFLANFVEKTLSNIYEEKYFQKNQSFEFWLTFKELRSIIYDSKTEFCEKH